MHCCNINKSRRGGFFFGSPGMSSSYRSSRLGLSHWDPCTMYRGGCLELYYRNMVKSGSGGIEASSARPTGFLQCFDTVGLVV